MKTQTQLESESLAATELARAERCAITPNTTLYKWCFTPNGEGGLLDAVLGNCSAGTYVAAHLSRRPENGLAELCAHLSLREGIYLSEAEANEDTDHPSYWRILDSDTPGGIRERILKMAGFESTTR